MGCVEKLVSTSGLSSTHPPSQLIRFSTLFLLANKNASGTRTYDYPFELNACVAENFLLSMLFTSSSGVPFLSHPCLPRGRPRGYVGHNPYLPEVSHKCHPFHCLEISYTVDVWLTKGKILIETVKKLDNLALCLRRNKLCQRTNLVRPCLATPTNNDTSP